MEYWEMDIWEANEFNFVNEVVEEFTNQWSQNLVNVRSPSIVSIGVSTPLKNTPPLFLACIKSGNCPSPPF